MAKSVRRAGAVAALAAIYAVVAKLGLLMDPVGGFATLVWPPTGISLAALYLGGRGLWPGVALGAFAVNLASGAPAPVALAMAAGNTGEAVLGAWALRRFAGAPEGDRLAPALDGVRGAVVFVLLCAVASTAVSATVGVASLVAGGLMPLSAAPIAWRAWWLGDMSGDLVVAAFLTAWVRPGLPLAAIRRRVIEAAALALVVAAVCAFLFGPVHPQVAAPFRQASLLFPLLLWASLRFGARGATAAVLAVSAMAIWGTARGHGPFVRGPLNESLSYLQVFIGVVAVATLVLTAAVAERDIAREQSRAAEATAQRAVRVRDDFVSIAAHELRTPLTALQLQVGALLRAGRKSQDRDASVTRRIASIGRQVGRLGQLVDRLLDVSRMRGGALSLDRERVDLGPLAQDVVDRLGEEAEAAGSSISVAFEGETWAMADPLRLEQVVFNLVSNAIKYGKGHPVEVRVRGGEGEVRLEVHDAGIGIPPADVQRIFGRFERAVSGRHFSGLGLGLFISREIVEAHGGSIGVAPRDGEGSTFTVVLPRDPIS